MNKKQIITFVLLVFLFVGINQMLPKFLVVNSTVDTSSLVLKEHINPQKLFDKSWKIIKRDYYDSTMNHQDWNRWRERYKGKIKTDEDANIAINTMLASLNDPYSRYLGKEEYQSQNESIDSKISGIGVHIASISGKLVIVGVIEGTPASMAKLQTNDIITAVDGKDINGMPINEVVNLVRGPENSTVELTVLRAKEKFSKKIKRKEIKIKTVKSSIDKNNIGYIQVITFIGNTTANEFIEAIEKTQNTDGLIIDLRGNTGGLLPNAVFMANLFIDNGNIVSIVGRNGFRKDIKAQHNNFTINKPIILLIDGASASASEIFSGALKDYHKAKLIGTKTYGKGMVQKIVPMPNESGINLTIAKYLTPSGHDINKKGIEPDYVVEITATDLKNRYDRQLDTAKSIMNDMIKNKAEKVATLVTE